MCECLESFKRRFRERYPTWKGREVKGVSLPEGLNFSTGEAFYYLPVYIDVGQRSPKETSLIIRHCPLCGDVLSSNHSIQPTPATKEVDTTEVQQAGAPDAGR